MLLKTERIQTGRPLVFFYYIHLRCRPGFKIFVFSIYFFSQRVRVNGNRTRSVFYVLKCMYQVCTKKNGVDVSY